MLQTLRTLLYRDHQFAAEATEILAECQKLTAGQKAGEPGSPGGIDGLLNEARSKLSVINHHFLKGRRKPL
jgi:hypothetical protein